MSISFLTKLTLLFMAMLTMMSNVAIITVLPHLKEYFSSTDNIEFLSRLMVTLPSFAISFLSILIGHIIAKVGKQKSAFFALILFSSAGSAGLYLDSINSLLISRFFLGIAIAILMIVNTSLIGDYFQGEKRHKFMGLQSAFISIGGVLFVVGGGFLSDSNWRYPFGIYLIGILLIPLVLTQIKENHKDITSPLEENSNLNQKLWHIYFLAFLLMLLFYILPTQMPFLIINHFGASGVLTGAIISSAFVFNALGAMSFAKLKRKFSFAKIYILGIFIISIGFILIGLVNNVWLFFFTSPIMGFGGGILMTTVSAWMLHISHSSKRVKSSGYLTSSLFFGQFLSPIIFHPIVSYFGIQDFFIVVGVSVFIISLIFFKINAVIELKFNPHS